MYSISKKRLYITGIILIIIAGGWFWYAKQKNFEGTLGNSTVNTAQNTEETKDTTRFVTDVDMDVSHWQTGGTEFLSLKFPKEWHWLESNLEKTGYYSQVITNNPTFNMDKYADIGVFTGGSYQMASGNGDLESIPLNDSGVVITTNNLGWPTSNSGTPREFMDGHIATLKKDLYPEIKCQYTSSLTSIPLTAFCSFMDSNNQKVETYYVSMVNRTFAFTARTSAANTADTKSILEKIAKSLKLKKDF